MRRVVGALPGIAVGLTTLALAAIGAVLLLHFHESARAAADRLASMRLGFIAAQLSVLATLWWQWPNAAQWIAGRNSSTEEAAHRATQALVQARPRIFLLLGACELVLVLRALLA